MAIKDIAAKPAKGRYFALSFGESASHVTKLGLMDSSGNRVRICFENAARLVADRFLFAAYRKDELVVLLSWDEAVTPLEAKKATLKALGAFASLKDEPLSSHGQNTGVWYVAERDAVGEIRFLKRTNHWQRARYRGSDRPSSSKARLIKSDDRILPWPREDGIT